MENPTQKALMAFGILLTFGLVAAARPALPPSAPQILTGKVADILTELEARAGSEEALVALLGYGDDEMANGNIPIETILARAVERGLLTAQEAEELLVGGERLREGRGRGG